MSKKGHRKNNKSAKVRIAENAKQRGNSESRIYIKKHSDAMAFLYETERTEIESMIQSADKISNKEVEESSE